LRLDRFSNPSSHNQISSAARIASLPHKSPRDAVDALSQLSSSARSPSALRGTDKAEPKARDPARRTMSTQPWVEKYRPQLLKDVVGNEETVAKLQAVVNGGNMPNIILSGLISAF